MLVGAAAAGAIASVARRARALSGSGRWAAIFSGTVAAAAGWWWAATLIAYFIAASTVSRWRHAEKLVKTAGTLPRASERSATQVFANGGLFVVFAFAAAYTRRDVLEFAALGALAAASSDTWSTEIGTLLGGAPRMIITWKRVEPGLSGGVSPAGLGAGIAGALIVALFGAFADSDHYGQLATAAAIGGVGGGVADSLLGALLQSKRFCDRCRQWTERRVHACGFRTRHARGIYWMSNDFVNVCATAAGAVIAVAARRVVTR
ncbi:MAG TPA: DUF92 domain-containing protein [Gemmatimonadaceae bacterium]|nr:DUF92 domain-containing protein [Gemmatimonadaceae bacterium]